MRIAVILFQVLVHCQVVGRDGKQVTVCLEVLTFLNATLPLPLVVGVATITTEANQVDTTTSLKVELAAPLIEELKQMDAAALKAWAKEHTGETFKGNPSLATIQQRVFDWVEQYGVPA